MRTLILLLAPVALLSLVSCGGQKETTTVTTTDKKAELCTNLARLNTSVATLKSLSPNSTVSDLKKAQEQVRTAFGNVKTSTQDVREAKANDLETAYANLDKAVQGIPASATLQQASQSIAPQVAAVESAQTQMRSGLSCS